MKSNMKQTIFIVVSLVRTVLTELQFEYVERKDIRTNNGILLEMVAQPIIVEESLWLKSKVSLADMENLLAESYDLHSNLKDVCDNIHDFLLDRRGDTEKEITQKGQQIFKIPQPRSFLSFHPLTHHGKSIWHGACITQSVSEIPADKILPNMN